MNTTWKRFGIAAAIAAVAAAGVTVASSTASATTTDRSHSAGNGRVRANEAVVEAFMRDVLDDHRGDHAASYFTPAMAWHGGSVGTVSGAGNVAGLMTAVVTSIPDLHAAQQDIFAQGDEVVVRLVVTGTQTGPILNIPASGKPVRWDAIDVYRLVGGKIAEEWAGEDFTAFLNDTGTYKAPWIQ